MVATPASVMSRLSALSAAVLREIDVAPGMILETAAPNVSVPASSEFAPVSVSAVVPAPFSTSEPEPESRIGVSTLVVAVRVVLAEIAPVTVNPLEVNRPRCALKSLRLSDSPRVDRIRSSRLPPISE